MKEKLASLYSKGKKYSKKYKKKLVRIEKRVKETISIPGILLFAFVVKIMTSFTSWIRAILLSWGLMDGVISNYIYKEEKFFPYQFLRYCRIVANLSGIFNPIIPVIWNIGDGMYSLYLYKNKATPVENLSRYGRILNGALLSML